MAGRMVLVKWKDHAKCGSDSDPKEAKPVTRNTVGWVVKETQEFITISPDKSSLGFEFGFCILKSDIIETVRLV